MTNRNRRASRKAIRAPSRRGLLRTATTLGATASVEALLPDYSRGAFAAGAAAVPERATAPAGAAVYDLTIAETPVTVNGRRASATTINGTMPGPLVRLREGKETIIRVKNLLDEDTSIHWHGVLVPFQMDGVPGLSFPGIKPGQTFEYRFPLKQYGTYWYHSHSGLQEQTGHYGPLVIEPAEASTPIGSIANTSWSCCNAGCGAAFSRSERRWRRNLWPLDS